MFGCIKDTKKKINTKGIGLGLMISKLIVEKFNGSIDFVSTFKKGSTFFFTFQLEVLSSQEYNQYILKHSKKSTAAKTSQIKKKNKKSKKENRNLFSKTNISSPVDIPLE